MKIGIHFLIFSLFSICFVFPQEVKIIDSILIEHVENKVTRIQKILYLSEYEVKIIKEIELHYLQKLQKLGSKKMCNLQKKENQLLTQRNYNLQQLLSHVNYLKYLILEKDNLERYPMQSE